MLAGLGCSSSEAPRPHVLLVSIDTLRADHLDAYGYHRETSPALTRLGSEGARFANAYAQSSSTVPTHASLFTGRLPFEHGSFNVGLPVLGTELTLAEVLRDVGYRTFALASSVRFTGRTGFDQGFEEYHVFHRTPERDRSRVVTNRAIAQIHALGDRPFFGFVHYFDPHQPYAPPEPYRSLWNPGRDDFEPEGSSRVIITLNRFPGADVPPEMIAWLTDLYDAEIRYLDVQLERLFAAVREVRDRPVLVIVTSDHGEEFAEHGRFSHSRRLHEELLRVPLFFWWPGRIPDGRVIKAPAASVDVMPTVLDLVGATGVDSSGRSLAANLLDEAHTHDPREVVFAQVRPEEWAVSATIDGHRYKLVLGKAEGGRLYDLSADPGGHDDIAVTRPEIIASLQAISAQLGAAAPAPSRTAEPISDELRDALRALGYVEEVDAAESEQP